MLSVIRFWKLGLLLAVAVAMISVATFVLTEPKMAIAIVDQGGGDNVAVAFNTKDDSTSFASRFRIVRSKNETVDQQNAAIAYANCDSCQTIANATQVVLVMNDDPEVITPTNVAIAINENCTDCETLANAYQTVIGTGGPVHFAPEGNRRIAELRKQYQQLRNSGLSIEEIRAQFDAYEAELNDILANELVPAGNSGEAPDNDVPEATPAPEAASPGAVSQEATPTDPKHASPRTGEETPQGPKESSNGSTPDAGSAPSGKTPGDPPPDESTPAEPTPALEGAPKGSPEEPLRTTTSS